MTRKRRDKRARSTAAPRWGWSGVAELRPPVWLKDRLRSAIALLPQRRSGVDSIVSELCDFGARYHANLHQDEFGSTRAERTAPLRTLLNDLDAVISHLERLPGDLRSNLSRELAHEIAKPSLVLWSYGRTIRASSFFGSEVQYKSSLSTCRLCRRSRMWA